MLSPLHRVRFSWNADRHIEIEWIKGRGLPAPELALGPFSFVEREGAPDQFALNGVPAICWRDDIAPLFEPFQLRENTEYFLDVTLPLTRAEAEARQGEQYWSQSAPS